MVEVKASEASGEGEGSAGSASLRGFRLFSPMEALNEALSLVRQDAVAFYTLSILGLGPLLGWLLGLEYVGVTRRLLETSTRYDDLVWVSALILPLLLGWKGICSLAQVYGGLEGLRRRALPPSERRALGPLGVGPLLGRALGRASAAIFAEFARASVLWLPMLLVWVWSLAVDPEMDLWARVLLLVVVVCFSAPVAVLLSAVSVSWMPAASGLALRRGVLPGLLVRGLGVSFALGFLGLLVGVNIMMGVKLLLFLLDALFAVEVGYWERFFSTDHRLYLLGVIALGLLLSEPVFRVAPTLAWVDAQVRRDALDLTSEVAEVRAATGRRVAGAATPENPSARGDRTSLTSSSSGLGVALGLAGALWLGWGAGEASAQDGRRVGVESLHEARRLAPASREEYWADLGELRTFVEGEQAQAPSAEEQAWWGEVLAQVDAVELEAGEERKRALALLLARLEGPRLLEGGEGEGEGVASPSSIREATRSILDEAAYRDLEGDAVRRDAPRLDLKERRQKKRAADCDAEEPAHQGGFEEPPSFEAPVEAFKAIALVLLVLALGVLGFVLLRRVLDRRAEAAARGVEGEGPRLSDIAAEEPGQEDVLAFSFGAWQARAEELASAGDYRLAVRCLYLALLVTLHRRGLIGYEPEGTNHEYEVELRRSISSRPEGQGGEVVLGGFGEVVNAFEYAWYGRYAVDAAAWERCRGALEQMGQAPLLRDAPEAEAP